MAKPTVGLRDSKEGRTNKNPRFKKKSLKRFPKLLAMLNVPRGKLSQQPNKQVSPVEQPTCAASRLLSGAREPNNTSVWEGCGRLEDSPVSSALQLVEQGDNLASPRASQRVAQSNGPAKRVHLLQGDAKLLHAIDGLQRHHRQAPFQKLGWPEDLHLGDTSGSTDVSPRFLFIYERDLTFKNTNKAA